MRIIQTKLITWQRVAFLVVLLAVMAVLAPSVVLAGRGGNRSGDDSIESQIRTMMNDVNGNLEDMEVNYLLGVVEYYTAVDEIGRTVFFRDVGNKQLPDDFVPGDPRRVPWSGPIGPGDDITWASDISVPDGDAFPVSGGGLSATQGAITSAMATWQNPQCSIIPLTNVPVAGNVGLSEFLLFGTGSLVIAADIVHAGFGTPIDALLPPLVIAATGTFFFVDAGGNLTDIDNNGKFDVAFREIYYTRNFPWDINNNPIIDIESVALHEAGHGLSQDHFGQLIRTDRNGLFHFSPRAVMNAGYTGVNQTLDGTDEAGHCSNWGSWPAR